MKIIRDLQVIRLTDRNRLWAGVAATALLAGIGGVLIGRSMGDAPAAVEEHEEGGETEAHAKKGFVPMTADQIAASGIGVERIEAGSLTAEVLAQATVTAPPDGQALLTARADGAVVRNGGPVERQCVRSRCRAEPTRTS